MATAQEVLDILQNTKKDELVAALNGLDGIEQVNFNDVVAGKKLMVHAIDLGRIIDGPKIVELLASNIGGELAGPQSLILAGYGLMQGWFTDLMHIPRMAGTKLNVNWDFPNECSLIDIAIKHGQLANLLKYADGTIPPLTEILNPALFDDHGNAKSEAEIAKLPAGTKGEIPLCIVLHQGYPGALDDPGIISVFEPLSQEFVFREVIPSIKRSDDSFEIWSKLPKEITISPTLEIGEKSGVNVVRTKFLDMAAKYGKLDLAVSYVDGKISEDMMIADPAAYDGKGNKIVEEGAPSGKTVKKVLQSMGLYGQYEHKLVKSEAAAPAPEPEVKGELAKMIMFKDKQTDPNRVIDSKKEFKLLPVDAEDTKTASVAFALMREGSFPDVVAADKLEGPVDISGKMGIAILYEAIRHGGAALEALSKQGIVGELEDFHTIVEEFTAEKQYIRVRDNDVIDIHDFKYELIILAAKQGLLQEFLNLMLKDVGDDGVSDAHLKIAEGSLANELNLGAVVNPEARLGDGEAKLSIVLDYLKFPEADSIMGFFFMTKKLTINVLGSMLNGVVAKLQESVFFKPQAQGGLGLWLDATCVDTSTKDDTGKYEVVYRAVTQVTKEAKAHSDPLQRFYKLAVALGKLVENHEAASKQFDKDPASDNLLVCMQPIMPNDAEEYVVEVAGAGADAPDDLAA